MYQMKLKRCTEIQCGMKQNKKQTNKQLPLAEQTKNRFEQFSEKSVSDRRRI